MELEHRAERDDELQARMRMNECRDEYVHLTQIQSQLVFEFEQCKKRYIQYFIEYNVLCRSNISKDEIERFIEDYISNIFFKGQRTKSRDGWKGIFSFNFGDLVQDERFNRKMVIVLKETKVYVIIWYFTLPNNQFVTKMRKKNDYRITTIQECTVQNSID